MGKKSDHELNKRIKEILGEFDPTLPPPKIDPVSDGVKRPTWSVMIPTFNCAKYLTKTLESVLEQDPGPEHMQIEVVDDCSTLDDPEKVVREVGKGRVTFHRNPNNSGCCTLNFNICIQRSVGKLVHILHGDDYVLKGFYNEIYKLTLRECNSMIFSTRSLVIDQEGFINAISNRLEEYEDHVSNKYDSFTKNNPLVFPGIVLKRKFYEEYGGFIPTLLHCADWEMWVRATIKTGLIMSPKALSAYRLSSYNDTSRFIKTGDYIKEHLKLLLVLRENVEKYPFAESLSYLFTFAHQKEIELKQSGDVESALNTSANLRKLSSLIKFSKYHILTNFVKLFKNKLKAIIS